MFRRALLASTGSLLAATAVAIALAEPSRESASALTNCASTSEQVTSAEMAVIDALNTYRQQNGLGQVTVSPNLSRAAAFIAEDMVAKGYFNHFEPGGRDPFQRAVDCGYPSKNVGENLAISFSGTNAVAMWKTSPGHNANMLQSRWKVAGVAQSGGYWALVLGATDDSAATGTTSAASPSTTATPTATPTPGPKDPSSYPIRRAMLQMVAFE